jgi:signal transduction histidine kinase
VVGVGGVTLLITALLVAPPLFVDHLAQSGESDPGVRAHAQEAFTSAFGIALIAGLAAALVAAATLSWVVARRLARPVVALADAADAVAAGRREVPAPDASFAAELDRLSEAFGRMARRLADADASRTRLLADLAHEIRTPLATLEAYIDGLEDAVVTAGPDATATMRDQVHRLRRLTDDLRDVAAADEHALTVRVETVDLADIAEAAVVAAQPAYLRKGVHLQAETTPALLEADPVRLSQVLANLLDNALRHTPSGGRVEVSVRPQGRRVRMTVADSGSGLLPQEASHVFDRLYTGDPSRSRMGGGSGLGLTIVRAIVEAHGGDVQARSDGPGEGTEIVVSLPEHVAVDPPAGSTAATSVTVRSGVHR